MNHQISENVYALTHQRNMQKQEPCAQHLNHTAYKIIGLDGCNSNALRNKFYNVCCDSYFCTHSSIFYQQASKQQQQNVTSAVYTNYSTALLHIVAHKNTLSEKLFF